MRKENNKYNVIIIGAGQIGAFYDTPERAEILSHAHAFYKHRGFNLLGFVDVNKFKARKAAKIWGGGSYGDISSAFNNNRIDIAVVAVPDEQHGKILKQLLVRILA